MPGIFNNALLRPTRQSPGTTGSDPVILNKDKSFCSITDFACCVSDGLQGSPRSIPSRFLYDSRGSMLFDQITRQPEYYLTRTEAAILAAAAPRIREITGPVPLVELGSGNSEKTDYLLGAWLDRDRSVSYIPVDVSRTALRRACRSISTRRPAVRILGLHADYQQAFPMLHELSPTITIFLGSSIGNFSQQEMSAFIESLRDSMAEGDYFLAGFDLVKDPAQLDAAYNDSAGVTAAFTRNLFVRMNRELRSGLDTFAVEHHARYIPEREQVEITARFRRNQHIRIAPLGENFTIDKGEEIQTEISRKFRLENLIPYFESFGFRTREIFTDRQEWFALVLMQKK